MNPQSPYQSPAEPSRPNPLSVMQPGEEIICEIKRHPIGIIGMYVIGGFLLVVLAALMLGVAPNLLDSYSRSQVVSAGLLVFIIASVFVTGFLFIATLVYWSNSWIVTSDSITQITRTGLFNKQSSQLSLESLEDVTAEQNGLLTHLFHYGLLKAETAGEHSKFAFPYCPKPTYYAQQILGARERFEQLHKSTETHQPQAPEPAYQQPYGPPPGY